MPKAPLATKQNQLPKKQLLRVHRFPQNMRCMKEGRAQEEDF